MNSIIMFYLKLAETGHKCDVWDPASSQRPQAQRHPIHPRARKIIQFHAGVQSNRPKRNFPCPLRSSGSRYEVATRPDFLRKYSRYYKLLTKYYHLFFNIYLTDF
jgi:hypothetical protein